MDEGRVEANTERLAVSETRLGLVEQEVQRARERLHDLESDRATLRLVVRQLADMSQNVEKVAERAAERAVQMAFERKDALASSARATHVAYATAGAGIGGMIATAIAIFLK